MWWIVVIFGLLILIVGVLVFNLVFDLLNMCKGYPPSLSSNNDFLKSLEKLSYFSDGIRVADLGCGYGNVINALKHKNISITGFEINPFLYLWCKLRFYKNSNIKIKLENVLECNLNHFDVVVIYGIKELVEKLQEKVLSESSSKLIIISNKFKFDRLKFINTAGVYSGEKK